MYFVNHEQIQQRLNYIPHIVQVSKRLVSEWDAETENPIFQFAQERALHVSIETVTDIGSLLIDAFILRDASSYEDIIDILCGEDVFDDATAVSLQELVKLRRPLVQEYVSFEGHSLHPLLKALPSLLPQFAAGVREFMRKELS